MTKLLIVDDNEESLCLLRTILEKHGCEVVMASNGAEALEKARLDPPDMVITDVLMPIMDGFTLCRKWKADETLKKLPIIFYTATYTEPQDEDLALSLGADCFIVKPIEINAFVKKIAEVLEKGTKGFMAIPHQPAIDDSAYLAEYNKVLIRKLEQKMQQLAQTNTILKENIVKQKQAKKLLAKQAEELKHKNADLQQFAYIISHDLKEPLRMISSFTNLLAKRYKGKLDSTADDFICYIVGGVARMQALIKDLLLYSRISTRGKEFKPNDCNEILQQSIDNLQIAIQESTTLITSDPLPLIEGDSIQLCQLLQNLIANAIKFCSKQPKIHVSAKEKNGEWLFSVSDNGIGIDNKFAEEIFKIFRCLHSREEYPGTGIGLSICTRIVERHGGRIWVESEPGQGSTFYFTIQDKTSKFADKKEKSSFHAKAGQE